MHMRGLPFSEFSLSLHSRSSSVIIYTQGLMRSPPASCDVWKHTTSAKQSSKLARTGISFVPKATCADQLAYKYICSTNRWVGLSWQSVDWVVAFFNQSDFLNADLRSPRRPATFTCSLVFPKSAGAHGTRPLPPNIQS